MRNEGAAVALYNRIANELIETFLRSEPGYGTPFEYGNIAHIRLRDEIIKVLRSFGFEDDECTADEAYDMYEIDADEEEEWEDAARGRERTPEQIANDILALAKRIFVERKNIPGGRTVKERLTAFSTTDDLYDEFEKAVIEKYLE